METTLSNHHEVQARERKVLRLLDALGKANGGAGFTAEEISWFTDEQWELAEQIASVHHFSPESRALTISTQRVRDDDVRRAADPFEGLN